MPVPAHDRVTFSGTFGPPESPSEIWSFSLTYAYIESLRGTTDQAATRAREGYQVHMASLLNNETYLTRTRVARVSAGGRVTRLDGGIYDQGDDLTVVRGERAPAPRMPLQTAMVVSFTSARQDASGKGRVFLPWPPYQLFPDFRVSEANSLEAATAVSRLALSISQVPGATGGTVVGLGRHAVVSSKGTASPVLTYSCGRVPDTMRSRRSALPEAYVVAP